MKAWQPQGDLQSKQVPTVARPVAVVGADGCVAGCSGGCRPLVGTGAMAWIYRWTMATPSGSRVTCNPAVAASASSACSGRSMRNAALPPAAAIDHHARRSGQRDSAPPIAPRQRRGPVPTAARPDARRRRCRPQRPPIASPHCVHRRPRAGPAAGRSSHRQPGWPSVPCPARPGFHLVVAPRHGEGGRDVLDHAIAGAHAETSLRVRTDLEPGTPAQQLDLAGVRIKVHGNRTVGVQHRTAAIRQQHVLHLVRAAVIGLQAATPPAMPPASPALPPQPWPNAVGAGVDQPRGPAALAARRCATARARVRRPCGAPAVAASVRTPACARR